MEKSRLAHLLPLFALCAQMDSGECAVHSLQYFRTASSHMANFPEYLSVGYVDGVQISHYDSESREAKAKQDWMNKITAEDPDHWKRETEIGIRNEQVSKRNFERARERFNQTGGVHMFQRTYGCEWDEETGKVEGWEHLSYDGEDFLSFELERLRWIAARPQAVGIKHEWEQKHDLNEHRKYFYTEECPSYLKKYLSLGRDVLMRTELPTVSLLQKTAGSGITCHASGFYPRAADLFWTEDGQELHQDVEKGETLPNHDGTFQTTAHLKAEPAAGEEDRYRCVFRLAGVPDDLVTPLDPESVLSNARILAEEQRKLALALAVPLALLALLLASVFVLLKRRRNPQAKYAPAAAHAGLPARFRFGFRVRLLVRHG